MTDLYIANTSKQHHDFCFRRSESSGFPTVIKIPAGTQALVVKGGDVDVVDDVINQHRPYGLVSAEEASKQKRFVGLCYRVDKPVHFKDMKVVFDKNDKVLKQQGEENVKTVAAAVNATIDTNLQEAGVPTEAAHVEVEVREENDPGKQAEVAVGAEVIKDGQDGRRGARNRRGS